MGFQLVLTYLLGTAHGQRPEPGGVNTTSFLPYADWAALCNSDVYRVDGYEMGLVASLDYGSSTLFTVGTGPTSESTGASSTDLETWLQLDFIVPTRYAAQYEGSSMEILLHNSSDVNAIGNDDACFTTCSGSFGLVCSNDTICTQGTNTEYWKVNARADDPCMSDVQVMLKWTDALNNQWLKMSAPNAANPRDNGDVVEIFFDARIMLWTQFSQKHRIDGYLEWSDGTERFDDGGWEHNQFEDFSNPDIWINDTRYLDYTIPFFLIFPRSVQAEFNFIVATTVTVLTVTGKTEIVNIDIHGNRTNGMDFGELDVTFTTSVQFPYAVRGPRDNLGQIRMNSTDPDGPRVEFIEWDDANLCYTDHPDFCTQSYTVRIYPTVDDPCTVEGTYTVQGWAKCVDDNTNQNDNQPQPCALNDLELDRHNLTSNNGYFTFDITIPQQNWCPEIVDEVVVTPTLHIYNDPDFSHASYIYNQQSTMGDYDVFSNNWIYCEVTYKTASDDGSGGAREIDTYDQTGIYESDVLIDIARATKIYMDIQLKIVDRFTPGTGPASGSQDNRDSPQINITTIENRNGTWLYTEWEDYIFANEPHVITWANLLDFDPGYAYTQDIALDYSKMQYRVLLCETFEVQSFTTYDTNVTLDDCFTNKTSLAIKYFGFEKVLDSEGETADNCEGVDRFGIDRGGTHNCIDENEIAWKFRLDERVIPVDPDIDNGELRIWVESEVYYVGNYQLTRRRMEQPMPSRRRLQSLSGPTRVQDLVTSHAFLVLPPQIELQKCLMYSLEQSGILTLHFEMSQELMAAQMSSTQMAIDWALSVGTGMEEVMRMTDTIQLVSVTKCDPFCSNIYHVETDIELAVIADETTRSTMVVSLEFTSNNLARAGHIMNIIQDQLKNTDSFLYREVPAFADTQLVDMLVENCDLTLNPHLVPTTTADEAEQDEADSRNTTLMLAAAAGFLLALIIGFAVRCYTMEKRKKQLVTARYQRNGTVFTVL